MIAGIILFILSIILIYLGLAISYQGFDEYIKNEVTNPPPHWIVGLFFGILSCGCGIFILTLLIITVSEM